MGRFAMTFPPRQPQRRSAKRRASSRKAALFQRSSLYFRDRPQQGAAPWAKLAGLALASTLLVAACGEGYREAPPAPSSSKQGQNTTAFKQGCLALRKADRENLLLKRLAKIAGQRHIVCRKISSTLEQRTDLDLAATEDVEQVSDASLIFTLTKLSRLSLADNRLSNLKGIRKLTGLTHLDVSGNLALGQADEGGESPDWLAVGRLPLRALNIAMTQTDNLEPFSTLYFLESLDLTGNENITDLSPIGRLANLAELKATGIALGNATKATTKNCPIDAASKGVREFCQTLVKPPQLGLDDSTRH